MFASHIVYQCEAINKVHIWIKSISCIKEILQDPIDWQSSTPSKIQYTVNLHTIYNVFYQLFDVEQIFLEV